MKEKANYPKNNKNNKIELWIASGNTSKREVLFCHMAETITKVTYYKVKEKKEEQESNSFWKRIFSL